MYLFRGMSDLIFLHEHMDFSRAHWDVQYHFLSSFLLCDDSLSVYIVLVAIYP